MTSPMVFVLFGLLVGPDMLGLIHLPLGNGFINGLAELTLVLTLFIDASRIDLRRLNAQHDLPLRLLGIGLPLTIAAGTGLALLFFPHLSIWEAGLLGVVLAPTDAALGQAVVENERVPERIRQTLNVESGLNDGLAFPALLVFLSLASASAETMSLGEWAVFIGRQLVLGPLAGIGTGFLGSCLVERAAGKRWIKRTFLQISVLSLALLAYAGAELIGGNGFIAAFTAGLVTGTRSRILRDPLEDFGEAEGQLLNLVVFLIFGSIMLPPAFRSLTWIDVVYALISLTAIRMIPVLLSLAGTRLKAATYVFVGWFGPRGLASIIYLLLITDAGDISAAGDIYATVITTVFLSVLLHGLSAAPAAAYYGKHMSRMKSKADGTEHRTVFSFPTRFRGGRKP